MKFLISRASEWNDTTQPCKEAVFERCLRRDERIVSTPEELNFKSDRDNWYKEGFDHGVVDGHIVRYFETERWFIELNTIEEMMEFHKKYGTYIVEESWDICDLDKNKFMSLKIYDYYIE